jgi:N-hydroxyarylamine O-acetyltransferase
MNPIDLSSYFRRIRYEGPARPDTKTLHALHRSHALAVPFENLDVILDRGISLKLGDIEAKIVGAHRGGWCFEQNGLFASVLEQIGFPVTRLAARVRFGTTRVLPRTHMILLVHAEGQDWLADVGYGGWGFLEPLPLSHNAQIRQGAWTFELKESNGEWALSCAECPAGPDQYVFTLAPQLDPDYEPANHYCATHPNSRFVKSLTVQLAGVEERRLIVNDQFVRVSPNAEERTQIDSERHLLSILRTEFGIQLPEDAGLLAKWRARAAHYEAMATS